MTNSKKVKTSEIYNDDSVKVLHGLEGIIKKKSMYIGKRGSFHLYREIMDNSRDEFINGFGKKIQVLVDTDKNQCTIIDEGRGMPNGYNKAEKKNNLEVLMTNLHAGAKFENNDQFKSSSGTFGIGSKTVSALSRYVRVESERDNGIKRAMEFANGKRTSDVIEMKPTGKTGTLVTFIPNEEVFDNNPDEYLINIDKIKEDCKMRTFLNKGLTIELIVDGKLIETFYAENGVVDYINSISEKRLFGAETIYMEQKLEDNEYYIAFTFENTAEEKVLCYTNGVLNSKGTQLKGLRSALTSSIKKFINDNNLLSKSDKNLEIKGEDARKGLVCIINVNVKEAEYSGQIKDELCNPEVLGQVKSLVYNNFNLWLETNKQLSTKLCKRVIQFARSTENVRKSQEKIVNVESTKSAMEVSPKYKPCNWNDPELVEIIIVEGNSAGGTVLDARDKRFQSVLKLRGKCKTVTTDNFNVINNNEEYRLMTLALFGTTDKKKIDIEKINTHKLIVYSDADNDGYHIRCLVLNFIYRYFPKIIENGYFYIGLPPLYRIKENKNKNVYLKDKYSYVKYVESKIKKLYEIKTCSLYELLLNKDEFLQKLKIIKKKYSISNDIIDNLCYYGFYSDEDISLEEICNIITEDYDDLKVVKDKEDNFIIEGFIGNNYYHLVLNDELLKDIEDLSKFYENYIIDYKFKGEESQSTLSDLLEEIDNTNIEVNRLKGLNESLALIFLSCSPQGLSNNYLANMGA